LQKSIFNITKSFHSSTSNSVKRISPPVLLPLQKQRWEGAERNKLELDSKLKQILIGTILGDVYMRRFSEKSNVRITFRQGVIHASYLLHLYSLFQEFVLTPPSVSTVTDKHTGKIRYNISFTTLSLPCFNEIYELFYLASASGLGREEGKKIIPNNIADFLTPLSLAYWIMDDGSFTGSGLKLHTNAFSLAFASKSVLPFARSFCPKDKSNPTEGQKVWKN
jgi:hypothetical protein